METDIQEGNITIRLSAPNKYSFGHCRWQIGELVLADGETYYGILCVDFESFEMALKDGKYHSLYFDQIPDEELLNNWRHFYGGALDEASDAFSDAFFQVRLALNSECFDPYVFVAYTQEETMHIKYWQKHEPKVVMHVTVDRKNLETAFQKAAHYLRYEALSKAS